MISSSDISCRITFSLASKSSNSDSMHAFFLFHLPLADTWKKLLRSLKRLLFFHPSKHCAHRSIGSRIKESAAYCNQILLVLLYLMYTQNTSVNWIYVVILLAADTVPLTFLIDWDFTNSKETRHVDFEIGGFLQDLHQTFVLGCNTFSNGILKQNGNVLAIHFISVKSNHDLNSMSSISDLFERFQTRSDSLALTSSMSTLIFLRCDPITWSMSMKDLELRH